MLVRDKNGKWRVWKDGQWLEAANPGEAVAVVATAPASSTVPPPTLSGVSTAPIVTIAKAQPTPSPATELVHDSVDDLVASVIRDLHLNNLSVDLKPRLENAIKLRLKDIRDTVDTREVLRKSVEEGGVGLTDDVSDNVIQAIMDYAPQVHEVKSNAPVTLSKAEVSTPITPSILYREASAESVTSPEKKSSAPASPVATPASTMTLSERPGSMVDVRTKPTAVGPIDELRLFTLIDFRRLDPNPKQAAARVKEKVKLLEDESYDKMVEGVRAWRISPLHGLYVALGQESLATNRPIAAVIAQRKTSGEQSLTEAEFDAIMELNRQLRF